MTTQYSPDCHKPSLLKYAVALLCLVFAEAVMSQPLQSWSEKISDGSKRFQVVANFKNEAVLDKETQLVWERSPNRDLMRWEDALQHCRDNVVVGRMGWRLPSISELSSLMDASVVGDGAHISWYMLSINHPFILQLPGPAFWSIDKTDPNTAWVINIRNDGGVHLNDVKVDKYIAWCVRGN